MNPGDPFKLLAAYNAWMNQTIYDAAGRLTAEELAADEGAFFGSLLGTLNHIVVADVLWLKRFATHPADQPALDPIRQWAAPSALNQILFTELDALARHRTLLDDMITKWTASLSAPYLEHELRYANTRGVIARRRVADLMLHFFNHQTHHRGQATTLLYQAGIDVGVTDLLPLIPDREHT